MGHIGGILFMIFQSTIKIPCPTNVIHFTSIRLYL